MANTFNPELFRGKYRIKSARAPWWEYYEGIYHIIIVTDKRHHYFGEITNNPKTGRNEMHLSPIGKFVDAAIPQNMDHCKYAYIPVWTVMPDHIHMIIMIDVRGRERDIDRDRVETCHDTSLHDREHDTSLHDREHDTSLHDREHDTSLHDRMAAISPKSGSLGLLIGRFKQSVTIYARQNNIPFKWQSRFYDVILFDQIGFDRTRRYIENNVAKWHCDDDNVLPDIG